MKTTFYAATSYVAFLFLA